MLVLFVIYILILYRGNQSNSSLPVEGHKLKNEIKKAGFSTGPSSCSWSAWRMRAKDGPGIETGEGLLI